MRLADKIGCALGGFVLGILLEGRIPIPQDHLTKILLVVIALVLMILAEYTQKRSK